MLLLCCLWVGVLVADAPSFPPASSGSSRSSRCLVRIFGARAAGLSPGCLGAAGTTQDREGQIQPRWLNLEEGKGWKC